MNLRSGSVCIFALALIPALAACGSDGSGPTSENTLAFCGDGEDNDGDGFVDCDDQDCSIFAACVGTDTGTGDTGATDAGDDAADVASDTAADAAPDTTDTADTTDSGADSSADTSDDVAADTTGDAAPDTADTADTADVAEPTPAACLDRDWCLVAEFTIDEYYEVVNEVPNTGVFDGLVGGTYSVTIGMNTGEYNPGSGTPMERTGTQDFTDIFVRFGEGTPELLSVNVAAYMEDGRSYASLSAYTFGPDVETRFGPISFGDTQETVMYTLEFGGQAVPLTRDADGYPQMGPVETSGLAAVRRFDGEMSDYAVGTGTYRIFAVE